MTMIRFIDLRGQIYLDESGTDFAFYDTVTDMFKTFGDTQVWECKRDFVIDFGQEWHGVSEDVDRYLNLIPDWVPNAPD